MFPEFRKFETTLAGRPLVVETGKMAQLANGECLVRYGDTTVHVAATAAPKPRDGVDFFPLSVDFEEKEVSKVEKPVEEDDEHSYNVKTAYDFKEFYPQLKDETITESDVFENNDNNSDENLLDINNAS